VKQILVVDDSKSMRHALRLVLDVEEEFEVCGEAVDGLDAIKKAKHLNPDVILLDLAMPKLNGAEVACVLRRENPHAKIIVFTMYATSLGRDLAAVVGVDMVISKAEGLNYLMQCIHEVGGQPN
jgi:DNA-binding NarL/FixJ family response regulator